MSDAAELRAMAERVRAIGASRTCIGNELVVMAAVVTFTLRWLDPHLPPDMRVPVRVYMVVIAAMVAAAVGTSAASGDLRIAAGAIAFAVSDLSVARDRFVRPSFTNVAWGLPLYYVAQVVLAFASGD